MASRRRQIITIFFFWPRQQAGQRFEPRLPWIFAFFFLLYTGQGLVLLVFACFIMSFSMTFFCCFFCMALLHVYDFLLSQFFLLTAFCCFFLQHYVLQGFFPVSPFFLFLYSSHWFEPRLLSLTPRLLPASVHVLCTRHCRKNREQYSTLTYYIMECLAGP